MKNRQRVAIAAMLLLAGCRDGTPEVREATAPAATGMVDMTSPAPSVPPEVVVPPAQQVLANVRTLPVAVKNLTKTIAAAGQITYDERRQQKVAAWVAGRVDHLSVNATGDYVQKGAPLLAIYSPDLLASEREYLLAVDTARQLRGNRYAEIAEGGRDMLDASRSRLRLWGITPAQVARLERTRSPQTDIPIVSPASGTVIRKLIQQGQYVNTGDVIFEIADLSTVWLEADVYETDLAQIHPGQAVTATAQAYPGHTFRGSVSLVYPFLNENTRTVRVRAVFANPGERLKPGIYLQAQLVSSLGRKLTVPASAVLQTGKQPVVWAEVDPGHFVQRRVSLGPRAGGDFVVLGGLKAGQRVASAGGFLLDSEAQLAAAQGGPPPAIFDAGTGRGTTATGDTQVTLQLPPGGAKKGMNTGELVFTRGKLPAAVEQVSGDIEMYMPGMPMKADTIIEPGKAAGRYTIMFAPSMQGTWTLTVNFKRQGRTDTVRFALAAR